MNKMINCCFALALVVPAAHADLTCTMSFTMRGWSLFYKTADGQGTITCSDNTSLRVKLHSEGGGLTAGQSSIDDGHGDFTGVQNIRDVLGSYVSGGAHGSAGTGSGVSGLTKGYVNLSLNGKGHGWEAGVDVSNFVITAAPGQPVNAESPPPPSPAPPQ